MEDFPQLILDRGKVTLLSGGKAYLIFGAETRNSSSSDLSYMEREVWPRVRGLNLNTLLVPVTWELLEPEPGAFDFTLADGLIAQAEQEGKKLIFLWFGLWKNGMSSYVPPWIRQDPDTYFFMRDRFGRRIDAISPLCGAAVERDAAAFAALLAHLCQTDVRRTVLMVQVENEMGLLGDCRDFSPAAERAYRGAVPAEFDSLYRTKGTWREAFGEEAPELFMTYCYAKATEQIAAAGRRVYPIPLYVNAWLEQYPWTPGTYPTGGPIARHMDLWKAFAPSIDFLAPDIYLPDFEAVCGEYTAFGNPLFVPEARPCMDSAANVFLAFGRFGALGLSPFAAEDLCRDCPPPDPEQLQQLNIMAEAFQVYRSGELLSQSYALLHGMAGLLERHRGTPRMAGFAQHREEGTLVKFSRCNFLVRYLPRRPQMPKGGGIIIELSQDEFLLCGLNFRAEPLPKDDDPAQVEVVSLTEGRYENDVWTPGRRLNGDERHLAFGEAPSLLRCRVKRYSCFKEAEWNE